MSRRTVVNLVWFGFVALLFVTWAANSLLSASVLRRPYRIEADFTSAVGLQPNAEVDYLGVAYGKVASVRRIPGAVRVSLRIDHGRRIPAGATAHIFRKSAIGEQYVNFVPPAGPVGGRWIRAGERVPLARTTVPLEFSELLRSASRLLSGVPPDDVRRLVHELAVGLSGRTGSLRQLAASGDRIGQTLADRTAALDRLATNNTRLTSVLAEHRGSLGSSLTDLRQVAATLREARGDVGVLLDRGSRLLDATAPIVAHQKGNLDCDLKSLERVIAMTAEPRRLAGIRTLLQVGPDAFAGFWDTRDVEPDGTVWARVGIVANPTNKAPQYVPMRELPGQPAVPPCTSPLRPATFDYRPASTSRPAAGAPATALLVLALGLAGALTVAAESVGLRSPR